MMISHISIILILFDYVLFHLIIRNIRIRRRKNLKLKIKKLEKKTFGKNLDESDLADETFVLVVEIVLF